MTTLTLWAAQYPEAAAALRAITVPTGGTTSEGRVQSEVRLEAARRGQYLTRTR